MLTVTPELSIQIPDTPQEQLTLHAKVEALFQTTEFLSAFNADTSPTPLDEVTARAVFNSNLPSAPHQPMGNSVSSITTPGAVRHLSTILGEYDHLVVQSAVQLRTYVTNKLIEESDNNDPKIRIRALELLGKIGDVGLFVERSEVTVKHKTTIELQSSIKERIAKLLEMKNQRHDDEVMDVKAKSIDTLSVTSETTGDPDPTPIDG